MKNNRNNRQKQLFLITTSMTLAIAIVAVILTFLFDGSFFDSLSNLSTVIIASLVICLTISQLMAIIMFKNKNYEKKPYDNDEGFSMLERFAYEIYMMIRDEEHSLGHIDEFIHMKFDRYYDSFRIFREYDYDLKPSTLIRRVEKFMYRTKKNYPKGHYKYDESLEIQFSDFFEELFCMPYRNINNSYSSKDLRIRDEELLEKMQRIISKEMKRHSSRNMDINSISMLLEEKLEKVIDSTT